MNHPDARRLLVPLVLALACPAAHAQPRAAQPPRGDSHRLIDDAVPPGSMEESVAQRLRQLREPGEMQELAQRLLKDEKLLKLIESIPPEQLKQLEKKIKAGQGLGNDDTFKRLIDRAQEVQHVSPEDADRLKKWVKTQQPPEGTPPGGEPNPQGGPPGTQSGQPPPAVPAPPPTPPRSPWAEWKDKSFSWAKKYTENMPDRLASVLDDLGDGSAGDVVREAIRSMSRGGANDKGLPFDLSAQADKLAGLGEHLPTPNFAWKDFSDLFTGLKAPSLPSFEGPRPASTSAVSIGWGEGFGTAWLWLALFAVLGFVLWKSVRQRRTGSEAGVAEHVGPWPVAPAAVATRRDLVLAFEYLALKCLGPAARARHHLDLAAGLGEKAPTADPVQRHLAAGELALLYEHARYTPDDERLSAEELAAARRDLCLLAGVAHA